MNLHDLRNAPGARHKRKRVGRGPGSGQGKTAGRGHKGQKSRSGYSSKRGFEGGQMPLQRRLPKRGFSNAGFRTEYAVVNVSQLGHFQAGSSISPENLRESGLIGRKSRPVKILGDGELSVALTVAAHRFSRAAEKKILASGGSVEVLEP